MRQLKVYLFVYGLTLATAADATAAAAVVVTKASSASSLRHTVRVPPPKIVHEPVCHFRLWTLPLQLLQLLNIALISCTFGPYQEQTTERDDGLCLSLTD